METIYAICAILGWVLIIFGIPVLQTWHMIISAFVDMDFSCFLNSRDLSMICCGICNTVIIVYCIRKFIYYVRKFILWVLRRMCHRCQ